MDNNCLLNLLKVISLLQENACINNCNSLNNAYNTRVVTLYRKDGSLINVPYSNGTSSYLRVSNINNNCITFLILRLDDDTYYSTSEYITININCICAVKCIEDVSINL